MIFIDTSFIIAWLNSNDLLHDHALNLLDAYKGDQWLTTDSILLEIGNSFARKDRNSASEAIELLLSDATTEVVGMDADLFARAFQLFKSREDKTWGLTDYVSFIVMQDRECFDALTSDIHFVQAGFKALLRNID
jgi:predicted nucleic acid-binding protein